MSGFAKKMVKNSPVYPYARTAYRRFVKRQPIHPLQMLKTDAGYNYRRLGTEYGGWTFVDDGTLAGSTIISAGLGEDGSFDIEFAKEYGAKVVVVDPTPRAVKHFEKFIARLGCGRTVDYVHGGKQPVESYDLRGLTSDNFDFVPKALWNENTTVKFFEPSDPEHVSHSIVNFQNSYSDSSQHVEVAAITMSDLYADRGLGFSEVRIIKLDIEGAEVEVIADFLDRGISPRQILVEFDELNVPSEKSFDRVDRVHRKLTEHGYKCIFTDGETDFLYYRANGND